MTDTQMADICEEVVAALEEGSPCPQRDCGGVMKNAPSKNCSCHTNPPCSSCVDAGHVCGLCGWESAPSTYEPEPKTFRRVKREPGSRRNEITRTHTDGPFNSTPFTDCCHVAAVNDERCPICKALIVGHDDGLDARRREVGPGNCLMCGRKRGDPAIWGNCNC